jgi:hypothetical protein
MVTMIGNAGRNGFGLQLACNDGHCDCEPHTGDLCDWNSEDSMSGMVLHVGNWPHGHVGVSLSHAPWDSCVRFDSQHH